MKGILKSKISPEKMLLTYIMAFLMIFAAAKFAVQLHYVYNNTNSVVSTLPNTDGDDATSSTTTNNVYNPYVNETTTGDFKSLADSVGKKLMNAYNMVKSWLIPVCLLACAIAFVVARLPGMEQRTVSAANSTIWGCIIAIVLMFALQVIFNVAASIGNGI